MMMALGKIICFVAEGTLIYVGAKTIINSAIEKANDKLLELGWNEGLERKEDREDFMKDYEFMRAEIGA